MRQNCDIITEQAHDLNAQGEFRFTDVINGKFLIKTKLKRLFDVR